MIPKQVRVIPRPAFLCVYKQSLNQDDFVADFVCLGACFSQVFPMSDFELLGQDFSVVSYLVVRIGLVLWNQINDVLFVDH